MKTGIVIASRVQSSRVHEKPFQKINGKPLIEHLLSRCMASGLPVFLAVPEKDSHRYVYLLDAFEGLTLYSGHADDPLARLDAIASFYGLEHVVRVCHDKVFVDPGLISLAARQAELRGIDYIYSSNFTAGSSFEVISSSALHLASRKYKNVEHISYAIRNVSEYSLDLPIPESMVSSHRLLVDYPEDLKLLELVLQKNGNDCTLEKAISFLDKNRWATKLNEHPIVTVYTCAFNAEKFIDRCIGSVAMQSIFGQAEYILVDDHSSDDTVLKMARASTRFPNIRFIRNQYNKGLASSSNVALSDARGKYIIRLDADDYFLENNALETMVSEISTTKRDAIYPDNYFGSLKKIQSGKENHHVGGAIFSRSAMNHLKFTEQLRGYEGLDFFGRARDQLSIGYLKKPMFFYRQRKDSMSKSNVIERAEIKRQLQEKYGPLHS